MKIFTIGVYGCHEDEFFNKLITNHIDTFCDIRQRRGVRGNLYSFVNSIYLQKKLNELGIKYLYEKQLAPTKEIRELQWIEDKEKHQTKKYRDVLGAAFSKGYCRLILDQINLDELIKQLKALNAENVVFFCLEAKATACHRSLVAQRLHEKYKLEIVNI